jgi:lysozyme
MAVRGFDGTLWDRDAYAKELAKAVPPKWVEFLTLHSTWWPNRRVARATPYLQPHGGKAAGPDMDRAFRQKMINFQGRVGELGGGWNVTVFENGKIGKGWPLETPGVHAVNWNKSSWSLEMCANFSGTSKVNGQTNEVDDPYSGGGLIILDTAAWVFAQWLKLLKKPASAKTIKFHRDNPTAKAKGKDCPGKIVDEEDFIKRVQAYMVQPADAPLASDDYIDPESMWVTGVPTGEKLNFRSGPGVSYENKGGLANEVRVEVQKKVGEWYKVKTPAGYEGWVSSYHLSSTEPDDKIVNHPAVQVIAPHIVPPLPAGTMDRGKYRYSDFCVGWCKRFESLQLKAYWDKGNWAIGYGHNHGSNVPPQVHEGDVITEARALEILKIDMDLQLNYLNKLATVPLTQGQVDAMILNLFQQGPGNVKRGKVLPLINAGKHDEAAMALKNWPTTNKGLLRRRQVEYEIYTGGKPTKW